MVVLKKMEFTDCEEFDLLKKAVIKYSFMTGHANRENNNLVVCCLADDDPLVIENEIWIFYIIAFINYNPCSTCNPRVSALVSFIMGILHFINYTWNSIRDSALFRINNDDYLDINDISTEFIIGVLSNFFNMTCFKTTISMPTNNNPTFQRFIYFLECPNQTFRLLNEIYINSDFSSDRDSNDTCIDE